ncbi:MAG: 1-acyl-sn-glycerol-3-phosphate acyltransferase [Planctomycetota bacterium]
MSLVFERPYEFVPPIRRNFWPWLVQSLRLYDRHLRKNEGVIDSEIRHLDRFKASLDAGHGIVLAPNHCRYADPLILGWPARELGIHVHAMASWHLFNQNRFESFALRAMGAFSVFREGNDRQSIETAVDVLVKGTRPLILFPEGTMNRTNDSLKPLLDGVAFIARTAAKRRQKKLAEQNGNADVGSGKVVIHPVGIKYLCIGDIEQWAHRQLDEFEKQLGWTHMPERDVRHRTIQLAEAQLALKEAQYFGRSQNGDLPTRRDALIEHLLAITESEMKLDNASSDVRERVRQIRTAVSTRFFDTETKPEEKRQLRRFVVAADLAQAISSFPDNYVMAGQATDTRIVETIQRLQETVTGKADQSMPLKAVIEFAPAIEVSPKRPPRGEPDPVMQSLTSSLEDMLERLAKEARPVA